VSSALLVVASLVGFVILWCAIGWLIARVSGWRALAARFPRGDERPTRTWWFRSGRMGLMTLNGALRVGASPRFLHLAILPGFVGFPPIALPWGELAEAERAFGRVRIAVGETGVRISISARLWDRAQQSAR
jgi:hypothetical protein